MAEKAQELAQSLECGICLQDFKHPRGLPCLHGFCNECLEALCEGTKHIRCPICQTPTAVPEKGAAGFPTYFLINTIRQTLDQDKPVIMSGQGHQQCHHEGETKEFYCNTCKKLVCQGCTVMKQQCRNHDYTTLKDASEKHAARLVQLAKEGDQLKEKCQKSIESTDAVERVLASSAKEADEQVDRIKKRHIGMIADVYNKYKMELKAKKNEQACKIKQLREDVKTSLVKVEDACKLATSATKTGAEYELVSRFPSLSANLEELIKTTKPTAADKELGHIDIKPVTALKFPDIDVVLKSEGLTSNIGKTPGKTRWDVQTAASASSYTHGRRPEGAVGGRPLSPDPTRTLIFVPVDAGVFFYIEKIHPSEITRIEKQFGVTITIKMDVNESSMLMITPLEAAGEEIIRGAKEAVIDLYSSLFAQLNHRIVDLEKSSIRKEALQRAIGDVERLYKEVMVKVSGSKVLIYGMKELDVKVANAIVTNRLYDTARSSPCHHQIGGDQHPDEEKDVERNELQDAYDGDDEISSPRPQDDADTPRIETRPPALLKYRLRQDRLTFKTLEGLKVRVYESDITKEKVGAIINAANEGLIHAGGVAGAIEKAAGPVMTAECQIHVTKHGMLYPSQVIWTGAGNLPCHYIIHAVGPRWGEYKNKDECYETLKTTFIKCLEAADRKLQVAGMSMPLISSGIFGMPVDHCVDVFYDAVTQFSRSWHRDVNIIKEVNLVEIDDDTVKTIQDHLVGKITGIGGGAVVRRKDPGNQQRREPVRDHHRDSMVTGSSLADRSRRAQSLDSATRRSNGKLKNQDLRGYDLHSDRRIKTAEDEEKFRKCSVCFSRRDLTNRKDCSHKLCRSCHKIGLYKGQCSFCKSKTNTTRSNDDRGRSKTKKGPLPDSKI